MTTTEKLNSNHEGTKLVQLREKISKELPEYNVSHPIALSNLRTSLEAQQSTKEEISSRLKEARESLVNTTENDLLTLRSKLDELSSELDGSQTIDKYLRAPATNEPMQTGNYPVDSFLKKTSKHIPEFAYVPIIGGGLAIAAKLASWITKPFKKLSNGLNYMSTEVFGHVGLWSGSWLLISQLYKKITGHEPHSGGH